MKTYPLLLGLVLSFSVSAFAAAEDSNAKPENELVVNVSSCKVRNVKPGEYAVAVMHDEDKNGELNTSMVGRPQEGWGVSKNAPARRFGPPKYEDAKLKYAGGQVTIDIKLRY